MKRVVVVLVLAVVGCVAGPTGDVLIALEAEETITDGLVAGSDEDNVIDGWSVRYTQFVATVGDVHVARTATGAMRTSPGVAVVDLAALPASGLVLASFRGLEPTRWDVIDFATPVATTTASRDPSVSVEDFSEMVSGRCTFLIAGALTDATHRVVDFRLCVPAPTRYGPCSTPDEMSGVAVVSAAATTANITIHGDHPWFSALGVDLMVTSAHCASSPAWA